MILRRYIEQRQYITRVLGVINLRRLSVSSFTRGLLVGLCPADIGEGHTQRALQLTHVLYLKTT